MVTVDQAIIAKMDKDGKHFEILVDPELAYALKEGKSVSIQKMLAVNDVYTDSRKGLKAGAADVQRAFGSAGVEQIAETIVKKGEVQLTTEFRRKKTEERRRQIADFISKYAINPQTKTPHPIERILNAMEQAKVSIDPLKSAETQVEDAIKALKPVIPISIEQAELTIEIPAQYSGQAYGAVKSLGEMKEQQWRNDGSLMVRISIPAGMKETVFRKINSITAGNANITEG